MAVDVAPVAGKVKVDRVVAKVWAVVQAVPDITAGPVVPAAWVVAQPVEAVDSVFPTNQTD